MTNQHVFEQVWRHFVVERNEPGMAQGVCFLRGANDTRCAIGLLIPDRLYDESMENRKIAVPGGFSHTTHASLSTSVTFRVSSSRVSSGPTTSPR